ncbi:hypothetical protein GQ457_12G008840 [Hibiscus cannabinus]
MLMCYCLVFLAFAMLASFLYLLLLAQPSTSVVVAIALDALLQNYAYRAFVRPKTGVLYDGVIPSNLIGFQIATIRVGSGS